MSIVLVFSTAPDVDVAEKMAQTLVEEQLAACVSLLPGVRSIYRWQGQLESSQETLLLIKTSATSYPALEARLKNLHPYELPEIVAVSPQHGLPAYFDWVTQASTLLADKDC